MYEKAKYDVLTKLGLDPSFFEEEFDMYSPEEIKKQPNMMGEDTIIMMDTYYGDGKTEQTNAALTLNG
jgi:hypothetical protein